MKFYVGQKVKVGANTGHPILQEGQIITIEKIEDIDPPGLLASKYKCLLYPLELKDNSVIDYIYGCDVSLVDLQLELF